MTSGKTISAFILFPAMFRAITTILCLNVALLYGQQGVETTAHRVLRTRDLRDAATLLTILSNADAHTRAHAALAAGSVQDTSLIPVLTGLLGDEKQDVRKAAAFALGQMNYAVDSTQRSGISGALLAALRQETEADVLEREVQALGKMGDAASLPEVPGARDWQGSGTLAADVALSIGRYAYRGIRNGEATGFAVEVLGGSDSIGQWKAAYALMRIGDKTILSEHSRKIAVAAHSPDPNVRMHIASVLGTLQDARVGLAPLISLAEFDTDWRVRVNAVKALALLDTVAPARVEDVMLKMALVTSEHVSLTALSALGTLRFKGPTERSRCRRILTQIIDNSDGFYSWRQQREASIAVAKLFGADSFEYLSARSRDGTLLRNSYIDALGYIPVGTALSELLSYSRRSNPGVQRATLDAILNSCRRTSPDLRESARSAFLDALDSEDIAVITTAASALADSLFADEKSISFLVAALKRLRSPDDVEPMVEIIRTLGALKAQGATTILLLSLNDPDRTVALAAAASLERITGNPHAQFVVQHTAPVHTDFDWQLLAWLHQHPIVTVSTSRGVFRFQMLPDEAPFTCISFARLIRRGFFDGLTFHRVVPNFVIQGGDPRGDGWGGPGYAIRSEFGVSGYEQGMVGVASAGKDTQGCQFFVTHSRQPHLDGRYTIFGRVTSGIDVVNLIQVGDVIEAITLEESIEN